MKNENRIYTMPRGFYEDKEVPTHWRLLAYLNGFFINGLSVWASNETISEELNVTPRSIINAVKILEEKSFIWCERTKRSRIIYAGKSKPESENESTESEKGFSLRVKRVSVSDRKGFQSNSDNNAEINSDSNNSDKLQVSEIIKCFEEVDVKNKTYYGNKTQRAAAEFLIKEYGFENVKSLVRSLNELKQKLVYCPSINSPWDLKEKFGKLKDAIRREQNIKLKNNVEVIFGDFDK